jgi:hypothetical protein
MYTREQWMKYAEAQAIYDATGQTQVADVDEWDKKPEIKERVEMYWRVASGKPFQLGEYNGEAADAWKRTSLIHFFPSIVPNRKAYLEKIAFWYWKMLPSVPDGMREKIWKVIVSWNKVKEENWEVYADYLVYDTAEQYWNILKPTWMQLEENIRGENAEKIAAAEDVTAFVQQKGLRAVKMNLTTRQKLVQSNYLCYMCEAIPLRAKAYGRLDFIYEPEYPYIKFVVSNAGLVNSDGQVEWMNDIENYWPTREPKATVSTAEKKHNCMKVDVRSIGYLRVWEDEGAVESEKRELAHIQDQVSRVIL